MLPSLRKLTAALVATITVPVIALAGTALPAHAAALPEAWSSVSYGTTDWGGVAVADIDNDGAPEIITGDHDGYVRARRADGTELWRSPAIVSGCSACNGAPTAIDTTPTVADIDGDGKMEIIVGVGSIDVPNQPGGLVVLNSDGTRRWSWYGGDTINSWNPAAGAGPDGYPEGVRSAPAVGDVDGDGKKDIVFGSLDSNLYVLNADGSVKAKFYHDDTIFSSPALHDVDGDGSQEIFFGGDSTPGGPEDWDGGVFRALRFQNGGLVQLWKQRSGGFFQSSPAIADIDGDGRFEVVTGTANVARSGSNAIYAWHLDDGSPLGGWPVATSGPTYGSVALGDVNGDGIADVVESDLSGHVGAWKGDTTRLWYLDPHASGEGGGEIASSPIIADLNGDGRQDVVTANGWGTFLLDGATGNRLDSPTGIGWSYHGVPAVASYGSAQRLVVMGFNGSQNRVAMLNLPGTTAPAWGMFKKNPAHLGGPGSGGSRPLPNAGPCGPDTTPKASPNPAAARGYWFLGGDGAVFSFGGAPFYGSLTSLGIRSRAVALAATPSGNGYWILGADGGVFSFGDAQFFGSMGGKPLNGPVVRLVPTTSGKGYWLLGSDGGVFSFGDARFFGSMGGKPLNGPVITMSRTSSGNGYWLVGSDGGVFSFGDARFFGSTGGQKLNSPVNTMTSGDNGYWLLAGDGGVFAFNVPFYGSIPSLGLCGNPRGVVLRATGTGRGYWVLGEDGGVFTFGDAAFYGSQPGLAGDHRAVDLAPRI